MITIAKKYRKSCSKEKVALFRKSSTGTRVGGDMVTIFRGRVIPKVWKSQRPTPGF